MTLQEKTAQASVGQIQQETGARILKELEAVRGRYDRHEIFRDWIGMTERYLSMVPHHFMSVISSGRLAEDPPEDKEFWDLIRERYDQDEYAAMSRATAMLIEASDQCYMDVPGEVFMQMEVANQKFADQYFTPWNIAYMMAKMTVDPDALEDREEPLTICDPCCGSGVMLLASAAQFPDAAVRSGQVRFYGQDIDHRCVTMARINLRLYGLNASGLYFPQESGSPLPLSEAMQAAYDKALVSLGDGASVEEVRAELARSTS